MTIAIADMGELAIESSRISEPGPVVEVRHLFRRRYGEPGESGPPNPYVAKCERRRGSALPSTQIDRDHGRAAGIIDFRYWPSLRLGYIDNVQVGSSIRRQGLGVELISFAVGQMGSRDVNDVYSFAVNQQGYRLLTSAGFSSEPAENPEDPWKRWFHRCV